MRITLDDWNMNKYLNMDVWIMKSVVGSIVKLQNNSFNDARIKISHDILLDTNTNVSVLLHLQDLLMCVA